MTALARVGLPARALEVFRILRARLDDELGIEPEADLRALHEAILRGELPQPAQAITAQALLVPRQLPGDVPGFTGHADELAWLTAAVPADGTSDGSLTSVALLGTAGIGKTALAVHWAARVADVFEDGQLFADLGGYSAGGPLQPTKVIRGFLQALGVPSYRAPADEVEQSHLYHSVLADKRVLLVLDNARDTEQVRPLLPASPRSMVLVTSRHRLSELVAGGGTLPLTVRLLTQGEARELLARRIGGDRVAGEPEAVEKIVSMCSGLPLALVIMAERAVTHPGFPL